MRVLVTGGTGIVGQAAVAALVRRGHAVRVLSRHARRDVTDENTTLEARDGDVANALSIYGSADGCDAVVHAAGVVDESPPDRTYERVNVAGTRSIVREAMRAGVPKLVFVSSLGADRGGSAYHASKRAGEAICREFNGQWVVMRPGPVYGPGDHHVSVLLQMVRTLPAVPTIGDGKLRFQPVWHEDLGLALALAVERDDLASRTLDLGGRELTCQNELVHQMSALVGRDPPQLRLSNQLASFGIRALGAVGIGVPFNQSQLQMLVEGNRIDDGGTNALIGVFAVEPLPLAEGLQRLLDTQPEQLSADGIGTLKRKRLWADIHGSRLDADELFQYLRDHLPELMPAIVRMDAERRGVGTIEPGATLTLSLPMRGHAQVRVAEVQERRITLLTVAGHPLAGAVRFLVTGRGHALRVEVHVYERPATVVDYVAMRTAGEWLQRATWTAFIRNLARAAGGKASEVERWDEDLSRDQALRVEEWLGSLSRRLQQSIAGRHKALHIVGTDGAD
jgi:NADH dehydrogenase